MTTSYNGFSTIAEAARAAGVNPHVVQRRLRAGHPLEKALLPVMPRPDTGPRFTEDQIRMVLISCASHGQLAKQFNCSPWLIGMIRYGMRYATVLPHLERWQKPSERQSQLSCRGCIHHFVTNVRSGHGSSTKTAVRCGLGLPDVITEGAQFARFCSVYQAQETQQQQQEQPEEGVVA